jgi:hexosaminidase
MTPWRSTYLDYPQSALGEPAGQPAGVVTLEDVYHQDLPPSRWEQAARDSVIGTQGQLWTEFVDSPELAEYLAFPRLCALAENAWSGAGLWSDFADRLAAHERRLAALNVNFRSASRTYGRT